MPFRVVRVFGGSLFEAYQAANAIRPSDGNRSNSALRTRPERGDRRAPRTYPGGSDRTRVDTGPAPLKFRTPHSALRIRGTPHSAFRTVLPDLLRIRRPRTLRQQQARNDTARIFLERNIRLDHGDRELCV